MANTTAELITGTVLTQTLLVHFLEEQGALKRGEFAEFLNEYLGDLSEKNRQKPRYEIMRHILKRLRSLNESPKPH